MNEILALFQAANTCLSLALLLPDCDIVIEMREILIKHCELCSELLQKGKISDESLESLFADLDQIEETIESIKSN